VSFTGSTDVGRKVSEACAPAFKHCHLEMGGKNVIMVMDDARLDLAVEGALWGGFGTTGQRCTAASRVVVHEKVYEEFMSLLVPAVEALKVGEPLDETTDVSTLISPAEVERVKSWIQEAVDQGAKLVSAVASIIDSKDPDEIERALATLPDFTSFANRYSVPASTLQRSHRQ